MEASYRRPGGRGFLFLGPLHPEDDRLSPFPFHPFFFMFYIFITDLCVYSIVEVMAVSLLHSGGDSCEFTP